MVSPGVLSGLRVIEFAAQGPGPFCGMLLADMGADVILVERKEQTPRDTQLRECGIFHRGKRSIVLDLKAQEGMATARELIAGADCVIEGFRPGVMERLGLGPEVCMNLNPRLVYGRMTGWGQSGPLAKDAGHDINYLALSGALWYAGSAGEPPFTPPTLVGDLGGGALYLTVGLLAGVLHARASGKGQIVDAAIVDGAANLSNILLSLKAADQLSNTRGESAIDGSHWYGSYRCSDGRFITVGAIEQKFYSEFMRRMGLDESRAAKAQYDTGGWNAARAEIAELFLTKPQAEWCEIFAGSDACVAPVLDLESAADHPHMVARKAFSRAHGMLQAMPSPRFQSFPVESPNPIPKLGEHQIELLELGTSRSQRP
jgi:acetyl-CoA hydrolase